MILSCRAQRSILLYGLKDISIQHAIEREKELQGWSRAKKNKLVTEFNPEWKFLNSEIMDLPLLI